jgi:uncharacterized membrane protein
MNDQGFQAGCRVASPTLLRPAPALRLLLVPGDARPLDVHHGGTFGGDRFGRAAEKAARFFGTPRYIIGQTLAVAVWITLNAIAVRARWDPYPFILLNLAFSTQAAYAAPLILLAQTRQAERDKASSEAADAHREEVAKRAERQEQAIRHTTLELKRLLEANTDLTREDKELTEQVAALTREIHSRLQIQPPR